MLRNTWVAEVMQQSFVSTPVGYHHRSGRFYAATGRSRTGLLLEQENLILPPSALAEALQQQSEELRSEAH